jgi:hypothetical protein
MARQTDGEFGEGVNATVDLDPIHFGLQRLRKSDALRTSHSTHSWLVDSLSRDQRRLEEDPSIGAGRSTVLGWSSAT